MGCCFSAPLEDDPSVVASIQTIGFVNAIYDANHPERTVFVVRLIGTTSVVAITGDSLVQECNCSRCCRSTLPLKDITTVEVVKDGGLMHRGRMVLPLKPGVEVTSDQGGGKTRVFAFYTPQAEQFAAQLTDAVNSAQNKLPEPF